MATKTNKSAFQATKVRKGALEIKMFKDQSLKCPAERQPKCMKQCELMTRYDNKKL